MLGRYQFPPSPESMLAYQLYTVRNGHQLTPTLNQGEGGIIAQGRKLTFFQSRQLVTNEQLLGTTLQKLVAKKVKRKILFAF